MVEASEETDVGEAIDFPDIELVEMVPAPTIYADDVAHAVLIGDRIHIVLYADVVGNSGMIEHHTVLRLVMKADIQKNAASKIATAILRGVGKRMKDVFVGVPKKDLM